MQREYLTGLVFPIAVALIGWCVRTIWIWLVPDAKRNATAASIVLSVLVVGFWFWRPGAPVEKQTGQTVQDKTATTPEPEPQPPPPPSQSEPDPLPVVAPISRPEPPVDEKPPDVPEQRSSQFVNRGAVTAGGRAALIVNARQETDVPATGQLARAIDAVDSLFKPAFVSEGLFTNAHGGDFDVLKGLGIDSMDMIALGVKSVTSERDDTVDVTRATVHITVRVIRPSSGFSGTILSVREVGVGFDADRADVNGSKKAFEKLISELRRMTATTSAER